MSFSKETWGNTVWFLFHTMAYKIKEEEFTNSKNDIIYAITTICENLPCPDCSKDASNVLKKANFNNIFNNKKSLQLYLFNFHNYINSKLNKPLFSVSELDEKYSKANFDIIYNNFLIIFNSNSNVPQLMSASFHRQHNMPKIINAIKNIKKNFI